MDIEGLVKQFLADSIPSEILSTPLHDEVATIVVERLKQEADRYWYIDYHRSLEFADRIIMIGDCRGDMHQTALGLMAKGDALRYLGRTIEAWESLEEAGKMFQMVQDEIGWARTRIGRLPLSTMLNRVAEALDDAERARAIFTTFGERERLLRLDINLAFVYNLLGNQLEALRLYHSALGIAEPLG